MNGPTSVVIALVPILHTNSSRARFVSYWLLVLGLLCVAFPRIINLDILPLSVRLNERLAVWVVRVLGIILILIFAAGAVLSYQEGG